MLQIPLEMANVEQRKVFGMDDSQRLRVVLILSTFAFAILGLLTLSIFFWASPDLGR